MVGKEDLGLSLTLGSSGNHHQHQRGFQWSDLFPSSSSSERRGSPEGLLGIDVNRAPTAEREIEEEAGVSSPNSTVSSGCGKRGERDLSGGGGGGGGEEHGISDEDDGDGSRKKLRLTKDQSAILEESFKEHNTLNPKQKVALAKQLNLRPRQVEVWFQNRRARTKLKQTEVDCEFLKRCCENLTDENRRLQKEVAELRALKLSPHMFMHMTPPTTLTMCPSCERVAATTTPSSSAAPPPPVDHRHLQHHPRLPWAPIPLRPAFMDHVHPQRS